jgi:hypothetical protein
MNLVKVLESSFIIFQHLFDILIKILEICAMLGIITSCLSRSSKVLSSSLKAFFSCAQVFKLNALLVH